MKCLLPALGLTLLCLQLQAQQVHTPRNVLEAYKKGTRSPDGAPGKNYWQNKGRYNITITVSPPSKLIKGTETITYINNSPDSIRNPVIKLIMNTHAKGAVHNSVTEDAYVTGGIIIDGYTENGSASKKFRDPEGNTNGLLRLAKQLAPKDSVRLTFDWHYELSELASREGKLDSTTFHLAYFYPRVAVFDDIRGWDRMQFTESQEFYNDFNDYQLNVALPKNFMAWATGDLLNTAEVLQPNFAAKYNQSLTSDKVINIVSVADFTAKNVTAQNETNTWKFAANHITDVAVCVSDHYVWDAASVIVDKKTGRRTSVQAAYIDSAVNFHHSVEYGQHGLEWMSNNWPGIPYAFSKSTVIQGTADMEYPMMANDSPQDDPVIQRFVAEHEIGHSWFPFMMGINEHRYGYMDEGWTTAFEYMIGTSDLGKEQADDFFKQFRVNGWALGTSEENAMPIILPTNTLSGPGLGNNEYGKPALAYLALKDMLGDDLFKKSLHGFMNRWMGKHPIPWDMFNSFNYFSGKDLNWFWGNWFFSFHHMDLNLKAVTPSAAGFAATIENIGGFVTPTNLVVEYADGSTETIHKSAAIWQANQKTTTVVVPTKKKVTYVFLDNEIFVDADETNNKWGMSKADMKKKSEPKFDASKLKSEDLDKYLGEYTSIAMPIKISVSKEGMTLMLEAAGRPKIGLIATGNNRFELKEMGLALEFDPTKKEMTLIQSGQNFKFTKQ
jgi:Peptidase family M1 domain